MKKIIGLFIWNLGNSVTHTDFSTVQSFKIKHTQHYVLSATTLTAQHTWLGNTLQIISRGKLMMTFILFSKCHTTTGKHVYCKQPSFFSSAILTAGWNDPGGIGQLIFLLWHVGTNPKVWQRRLKALENSLSKDAAGWPHPSQMHCLGYPTCPSPMANSACNSEAPRMCSRPNTFTAAGLKRLKGEEGDKWSCLLSYSFLTTKCPSLELRWLGRVYNPPWLLAEVIKMMPCKKKVAE